MVRGTVPNSHKAPHCLAGYCYILQRQQVHGSAFLWKADKIKRKLRKVMVCYAIYELSANSEEKKYALISSALQTAPPTTIFWAFPNIIRVT